MPVDRYGPDVLSGGSSRARRVGSVDQPVELELVLEDAQSGFCGAVVWWESGVVELEDRHGRRRCFPFGPGFLLEGRPVALTKRAAAAPTTFRRTASGSIAVPNTRARVAREARIYVEGRHDAELVEQVWGDDLRIEGVVVEQLDGVDDLVAVVADFAPAPGRRLGVLVDHLVAGSKEQRIAARVRAGRDGEHVLVVGHPYVDIWAAVKPARVGLARWPDVPRDVEWKSGACAALGWPHAHQSDLAQAWQRIRGRVRGWTDLEPELLARVEELIDFVTAPDADADADRA